MNKRSLLVTSFFAAVVFTGLDSLVHYFYEPLELYHYPIHFLGIQSALGNYALSKLVSSTALLFALFYLVAKLDLKKAVADPLVVVAVIVLLEIRYILAGEYTATWHVLNLINHFVSLSVGVYLVRRVDRRP